MRAAAIAIAAVIAMASSAAEARDLRVNVHNNSHQVLTHLWGSHRDARTWENDILGSSVLSPHASAVFNFEDFSGYCIFDIKVRWADGAEAIAWGQNVCEITDLTFNH